MKHSARLTKPFFGIRENVLKSKSGSVRGLRIPCVSPDQRRGLRRTGSAMLAEKYMLLLETIRSLAERGPAYADGAPRVISTSPHVPAQLPGASRK
jgi:hypothetical protein